MEPQPKVLYTSVRTAARPRPRLRNGQANLVPSRFHLLSVFGILAVVIAAHFFITRQPWRSTRAELVPDSTEAQVVRNDVPNFCFVHITNKVVSFDPRDQSLYQTSMYHVFDYTVRHGYQYFRVVDVSGQEGYLVGVWSKVKHVIRLIDLCRHVVVMDTDVFIASQHVPFTSMLKDWGYTSDTLVVGYTDSRACYKIDHQYMTEYVCNEDEMKVVANRQMNTGFVVFKNHPKVKRLLKYWYACRDPVVNKWNASQVLENCGGLRYDRPYSLDQTVWNGVIRPKFGPVELLLVGCEYVGQGPFDPICIGKHFQHRMYDKYKNETKGYIERDMAAKYNETERLSLMTSLINGNHVRLWY